MNEIKQSLTQNMRLREELQSNHPHPHPHPHPHSHLVAFNICNHNI